MNWKITSNRLVQLMSPFNEHFFKLILIDRMGTCLVCEIFSICMYAGEATKQQSRAVSAGLWGTWRKQETTGGFSCVDLNSIYMEDCDNGPDHAMIVVVLQNAVYNMQLLKLCVVGRRVRGDDWAIAEEWGNETSTQRPSHGAPGPVSDWGTAITFLYYTLIHISILV